MDNYIQKINSRSGDMFRGNEPGSTVLQPENHPVFPGDTSDFLGDDKPMEAEPGNTQLIVQNLSPLFISRHNPVTTTENEKKSSAASEQKETVLPAKEQKPVEKPAEIKPAKERSIPPLLPKEKSTPLIIE